MASMRHCSTRYLEVRLRHLDLSRSGRRVLTDITWTIRPGEHWVLAGGNGAGKTQLLKILGGIVWPAPARVPVLRYCMEKQVSTTAHGIKEEIAYLGAERQDKYQRYGWNMSAERIVGTGLYRTDIPLDRISAADARRIRSVLSALAVDHLAQRDFLSRSYGERRVILMARALLARPRLLLLDEVFNGLDEVNRHRILHWLARAGRRLPWVLATHRLEDVPAGTTHALVLDRGRIVYRGSRRRAPLARWLARSLVPAGGAPRRARRGRPLISLRNAAVHLDERRVLQGVSLTVHPGEWWLIHGHNGSGKTTLLRTLYGDHGVAAGGTVERAGVIPGVHLDTFKKRVGLIAPHLQADHPRELTVLEVVQSGRYASIGLNDPPTRADHNAARRALERFGLGSFATRTLAELSYGQARRALFARAWVRAPKLLLLDEPFAGIDAATHAVLLEHVRALANSGTAVVVTAHHAHDAHEDVTHELELVAGEVRYCGPLRDRNARAPRAQVAP
jgi:molybdate transport system ATP-binding protein